MQHVYPPSLFPVTDTIWHKSSSGASYSRPLNPDQNQPPVFFCDSVFGSPFFLYNQSLTASGTEREAKSSPQLCIISHKHDQLSRGGKYYKNMTVCVCVCVFRFCCKISGGKGKQKRKHSSPQGSTYNWETFFASCVNNPHSDVITDKSCVLLRIIFKLVAPFRKDFQAQIRSCISMSDLDRLVIPNILHQHHQLHGFSLEDGVYNVIKN